MGAVPKHKTSRHRRGRRRASINLTPPNTQTCPQCSQPKRPHQACSHCGWYPKTAPSQTA